MNKITIIGLGLIGNSIGMAVKRAATTTMGDQVQPPALGIRVVGFDPNPERETAALRRFGSVDEVAPDLQRAVQGAQLVVVATPDNAVREVLEAIAPYLEEGATVTDTMQSKEAVMSWAGEALGNDVYFVGGHPLSNMLDLTTAGDDALPNADLFAGAPYCVLPTLRANNESLNRVIRLVEMVGARLLFIDTLEHDSFVAAAAHLPVAAAATLLRVTAGGPTWSDMSMFAGEKFSSVMDPLSDDPQMLADSMLQNRQALLRWVDQYMYALSDLRDILTGGDRAALLETLQQAHTAQANHSSRDEKEAELRHELREALADTKPMRGLMGGYLSDKLFRKKDK